VSDEDEKTRKQRPFPRDALENALDIAKTIQEQNNGQPMKRIFMAAHLKIKLESSNCRYLIGSSGQYGLTRGDSKPSISLSHSFRESLSPRHKMTNRGFLCSKKLSRKSRSTKTSRFARV
jgi:hypothetical protein